MQNLKLKHYSVHELIQTTNQSIKSISLKLLSYGKSMFFFSNGYTIKKCVILGAQALVRVPNITHF